MTSATTERFEASDGVVLQVYRWDGLGLPILLLHGFLSDASRNWQATGVVETLTATGRPVVAFDARGHGGSDKPDDPNAYGEARMAADVTEYADDRGFDGFDLVGYSMGGAVGLMVASLDRRLRRLVVGGLGGRLVESGFAGLTTADAELAEALETEDPDRIPDPVIRSFRRFADTTDADLTAAAAHVRCPTRGELDLSRISAPTLVLAGEDDVLAPDPERLAAAISGARLLVTEGDHLRAVGTDRFRQALVDFLTTESAISSPR